MSFLYSQCDDGQIEIWGICYPIETTFELVLTNQGIGGSIPDNISALQNLMFLDLSHNELDGNIPNHIFNLENLIALNLSNNNINGEYLL